MVGFVCVEMGRPVIGSNLRAEQRERLVRLDDVEERIDRRRPLCAGYAAAPTAAADEDDNDKLRFPSWGVGSFELRRAIACAAAALPCSMTCLWANVNDFVSLALAN